MSSLENLYAITLEIVENKEMQFIENLNKREVMEQLKKRKAEVEGIEDLENQVEKAMEELATLKSSKEEKIFLKNIKETLNVKYNLERKKEMQW